MKYTRNKQLIELAKKGQLSQDKIYRVFFMDLNMPISATKKDLIRRKLMKVSN